MINLARTGIPALDYQKIVSVLQKFPEISKVILYGSRARGDQKHSSDIDLTIFGKNLESTLLSKIETDIDDLLLPYKIDLSIYDHLDNKSLVSNIDTQGLLFYQNRAKT